VRVDTIRSKPLRRVAIVATYPIVAVLISVVCTIAMACDYVFQSGMVLVRAFRYTSRSLREMNRKAVAMWRMS
jgi:putative exporter of polyketide antibiotics